MSKNLIGDGSDFTPNENRNTKKVCFKDPSIDTNSFMAVDSNPMPMESWKDKFLGNGNHVSAEEEDLKLLEGDITRTTINRVPVINFSKRIQPFLIRDMAITVVVKLLGQNIAYSTLHNRIFSLRKPLLPFI
ncbi:hypothetical protein PVK06_034753 [Gossypium arboreum]|uniref:Uncharacterized protein n=1 Tax=Gossypium arboreum TaxID=29729 RepID=A0ABR0NF09_GOSAR|nr:hypothetical protein PVK06_034753 [Gossypium arboreum]